MEEARWGDNDGLSDLPIDVFADSEGATSRRDSGRDCGPSGSAGAAVHGELAVEATDALVTEHGLLFAKVIAVKNELQITVERGWLSTSNKCTAVEGDEVCVDCDISVIGED